MIDTSDASPIPDAESGGPAPYAASGTGGARAPDPSRGETVKNASVPFEPLGRREGEQPRFLPGRADTPASLRRRIGLPADDADLLEAIAFDIRERGHRLVAIVARHWPDMAAKAVGALLSDGEVEVASEVVGWPDIEIALSPAVETAPAIGNASPRTRVLVAEQSFRDADAGAGVGGLLRGREGDPRMEAAMAPLQARLEAADAYVIVALRLGGDRQDVAETFPEAYRLPWLGAWLATLDQRSDMARRSDVEDRFGKQLRDACTGTTRQDRARERELFQQLEDLMAGSAAGTEGPVEKAFEEAIANATKGEAGRTAAALDALRAVFGKGDKIARTLFTARIHMPDAPWRAVVRLVEILLPEEPVPSIDLLPQSLLEPWQDRLSDAERFGSPRPPLPSWRAVFCDDTDRHLGRSRLQSLAGRIVPHASLRQADTAGLIAAHYPEFLHGLYRSLLSRRPYAAPGLPLQSLLAFHLSLAESLGLLQRIVEGDEEEADLFARTIASMGEEDEDFPGVSTAQGRNFASVAFARNQAAQGVAEVLDALLTKGKRQGHDPVLLVDALLSSLARILPQASLMRTLGAFALGGRLGRGKSIAEADIASYFKPGASIPEREEARRQAIVALVTVTDLSSPKGSESLRPSVRPWLDGLRLYEGDHTLARLKIPAGALATYAEDFATQTSIPMPAQPAGAVPALAFDLFDGPPDEAPGLIVRMLAREPRAWLRDLEAYERFASPRTPSNGWMDQVFTLEMAVHWRIRDVAAVLLDGLDETDRKSLLEPGARGRKTLPEVLNTLWQTASSAMNLPPLHTTDAVERAILEAHRAEWPDRSPDHVKMMGLYPPALFVHWRLRRFGTTPLQPSDAGYEAHRHLLLAIRGGVEAAGRRPAVAEAFAALARAQRRIENVLHDGGLQASVPHFKAKTAALERLADFMAARRPSTALAMPAFRFGDGR